MPTFTIYWQDKVGNSTVRGHKARIEALSKKLESIGWTRIDSPNADVALFDIFDEDYGIKMVRSSMASIKIWIGNRTAQNVSKILNEDISIYADQDWGKCNILDIGNDQFFVSAPMVDEEFLLKLKAKTWSSPNNGKTILIPGGKKTRFIKKLITERPFFWNNEYIVVAENMDKEELLTLCQGAREVYCTPSVIAMELVTIGVQPRLVVTSVDQIGNYLNQNAMIRGFEGGVGYLARFIDNYYKKRELENG